MPWIGACARRARSGNARTDLSHVGEKRRQCPAR